MKMFMPPQNLVQPILPGWNLGSIINGTEENSTAPDTERDIVAHDSYGRQLGKILDALEILITERAQPGALPRELGEILQLHEKIEETKAKAAKRRLDRVTADLDVLKQGDQEEYARIVSVLRSAIDRP